MSNTFRRDKLFRLAQAGRLVVVESYHFDDQYGESRGSVELPVRVQVDHGDWKDGYYNIRESDFTGKEGQAIVEANGNVCLYVHSNKNVTFRIFKDGEKAPEPIPQDDPRRRRS